MVVTVVCLKLRYNYYLLWMVGLHDTLQSGKSRGVYGLLCMLCLCFGGCSWARFHVANELLG